ncbi:MAG: type III secretion system export apparatus subunit SctU [Myxococcaceae bacterium]|nr:type III secretion system export apparatus subunit SctU [Myxococcaceae bacterium]
MSGDSGEKTEEPTQKKIDDSRKKGQVWKSKDLTGVAVFLVGLAAVKASWDTVNARTSALFDFAFDNAAHPDRLVEAIPRSLWIGVSAVIVLSLPVLVSTAVIGGLMDFLMVGPLFTKETLTPKLEKLNPIAGLKNLVSTKQLVELLKSTLKIGIAGYVVYGAVKGALPEVMLSIRGDARVILAVLGDLVYTVSVRVGLLFLVFAIFDVWFQRRAWLKDLMMTKEEVKREYKESEGDPHHKAKRREMHQEILESAQMEAVKSADVIITNPDHVAVALQYDREKDSAPRVVAKGIDHRAERIKALAKEHEVAMLRNVPLAHALLRVEVNTEIPEELYDAVAEVLNFVYGLKQQNPRAA